MTGSPEKRVWANGLTLLVVLDIALGTLVLVTGFRLWRFAVRGARSNRDQ